VGGEKGKRLKAKGIGQKGHVEEFGIRNSECGLGVACCELRLEKAKGIGHNVKLILTRQTMKSLLKRITSNIERPTSNDELKKAELYDTGRYYN
jgi:hypothetical protein